MKYDNRKYGIWDMKYDDIDNRKYDDMIIENMIIENIMIDDMKQKNEKHKV